MPKPSVLITGAGGFIGSACVRLLKDRYDVAGLFHRRPDGRAPGPDDYVQDIIEPFSIDRPFDAVIHLAALNFTNVGKPGLEEYRRVHVEGTRNLINAVQFKKFIFFSTYKVYRAGDAVITENTAIEPQAGYELSKYEAEAVCRNLVEEEKLLILRPVNIVGEGQPVKALIPVFFQKARKSEPIEVFAPRNTRVQLLHYEDVVDFLSKAVTSEKFGIFNLAPDESVEVRDIAQKIVQLAGSASEIKCTNDNEAVFSKVSAEKARQAFGWQPRIGVEEILKRYAVHQA